ncbi:MAG TPA: MBL fold metallo-hydrolase [Gaiellaceae bacterium]|nr:MBL fold metallo-hydrolase [Gaiellaceae bacterium]
MALLDLRHLDRERVVGAYLLAGDEPALVDCGPTSCLAALRAGLEAEGMSVGDLRHLVLTHVHLDHAGAAGELVRENPGLVVHVSAIGAPHLVDPSRLERSARRLYGDDFDRLWGPLAAVPEANVRIVERRVLDLEAFPTPGHASHHVSYLASDGSCYVGDAAGVRIPPARYVAPVSPPPDIDLEAWERTFAAIEERRPARLCLPHFGVADDPEAHVEECRRALAVWAERARDGTEEAFVSAAEADLRAASDPATADLFQQAGPFWQSYAGLRRYWEKKEEAADASSGTV